MRRLNRGILGNGTDSLIFFVVLKWDHHSFVILAVSLAAGLGVTFIPESLTHFPHAVQSVLESGIATGSSCALILNVSFAKITRAIRSHSAWWCRFSFHFSRSLTEHIPSNYCAHGIRFFLSLISCRKSRTAAISIKKLAQPSSRPVLPPTSEKNLNLGLRTECLWAILVKRWWNAH